jgi:ankyrin repeat protein
MDINAIFSAIGNDDDEFVLEAIRNGFDVNMVHPRSGMIPIILACQSDSIKCLSLFLSLGVNPNGKITRRSRVDGRMHRDIFALRHVKSKRAVDLLVAHGADLTLVDGNGETALANAWNDEVRDALRAHGAV